MPHRYTKGRLNEAHTLDSGGKDLYWLTLQKTEGKAVTTEEEIYSTGKLTLLKKCTGYTAADR